MWSPVGAKNIETRPRTGKQEEQNKVKKIYIGNLPFSTNEAEIRELFEAHGTVTSVNLITDRDTGRLRGFGFIEMEDADAATAIETLDGHDFGGRPLKVNEARDRQSGPRPRRW